MVTVTGLMDITPPSRRPSAIPRGAKLANACSRCHTRKIKCDGSLPICSACHKAKYSECNVTEGVWWPHTKIQELEDRVRWLEGLVNQAFEGPVEGVETATDMRIRPGPSNPPDQLAEEVGLLSLRGCGSYVGAMAGVTLSVLIGSCIRIYGMDPPTVPLGEAPPPPTHISASLPPKRMVQAYTKQYVDRIHRWYPFLDLDRLGLSLQALYEGQPVTPYERFAVFAVLALATGLDDDPYTPTEYLSTAISFLPRILSEPDMDALRASLLLCVYGLRSPQVRDSIDVWQLVGFALRLGIQLGLTRSNYKWNFTEQEKEDRRRIFWTIYSLERVVATSTGRILGIRNEGIDAQLPKQTTCTIPNSLSSFLGDQLDPLDLSPSIHLISHRRLLGDIMECVYITRPQGKPSVPIEQTSARVYELQFALVEWQRRALQLTEQGTVEHLVLQLAFHHASLVLHRPSPSFPTPPLEVLEVCLGSARATLQICATAMEDEWTELVIPGWEGFARVFTAGLTLMYCSWAGWSCASAIKTDQSSLGLNDRDLAASITMLQALTTKHSFPIRYVRLYRTVMDAFTGILRVTPSALLLPTIETELSSASAQNAGFVALEGLELDQEVVEMMNQFLNSVPNSPGVLDATM